MSTPLHLPPPDKLDLLGYLDEFHYWRSLDDERICKRCGRTITGRQIVVIELQGTRGKLRLQCPTAGCASTPGDWAYANPVEAAKRMTSSPESLEKQDIAAVANQQIHHGERAGKRKVSAAVKRASLFAPAPSFRAALARLVLVRPIATALHAFRPVA
ncbi:MAG TPA: hypothetical protein VGW57_07375 [Chthoniobacterales bacterium]|nr:hypothetical protein [Chthoniobacterales bacterium]